MASSKLSATKPGRLGWAVISASEEPLQVVLNQLINSAEGTFKQYIEGLMLTEHPETHQRFRTMIAGLSGKEEVEHDKRLAMGEEAYLKHVRSQIQAKEWYKSSGLFSKVVVATEVRDAKKKTAPKKGSKADQLQPKGGEAIIAENTEKIMKAEVDKFFENPKGNINAREHHELYIAQLIYEMCDSYKDLSRIHPEKDTEKKVYGWIAGVQRVLAYLDTFPKAGESTKKEHKKTDKSLKKETFISQTAIQDLRNLLKLMEEKVKFDPTRLARNMAELLVSSPYDGLLPKKPATINQTQEAMINFFLDHTVQGIQMVQTPPGSGKTTTVVLLIWLLKILNRFIDKKKIIFCSPFHFVNMYAAHIMYLVGIPFAFVHYEEAKWKLDYSNACEERKVNKPNRSGGFFDFNNTNSAICYICTPPAAEYVLRQRLSLMGGLKSYLDSHNQNPDNFPLDRAPAVPQYCFLGDEMNYRSDIPSSQETTSFVKLLRLLTEPMSDENNYLKVILTSATLNYEECREMYDTAVARIPGAVVKTIHNDYARVGASLYSKQGSLFVPHYAARNRAELITVSEKLYLFGRYYTIPTVIQLSNDLQELNDQHNLGLTVPSLSHNLTGIDQSYVQKMAGDMLKMLIDSSATDEMILALCSKHLTDTYPRKANLSTIISTSFGDHNRGCVIFAPDVRSVAASIFQDNYGEEFMKLDIDAIIAKYQADMQLYQRALQRIEDKRNSPEEGEKMSKDARVANLPDLPQAKFPKWMQLGSQFHINKFRCGVPDKVDVVNIETIIELRDKGAVIDPMLLKYLMCGVGLFTNDGSLPDEYIHMVLKLINDKKIRVAIFDGSGAFGLNLAVSSIVTVDGPVIPVGGGAPLHLTSMYSINTFMQMYGRAGRGGHLSYQAQIYTTSDNNEVINAFYQYLLNNLDEGDRNEARNIMDAFHRVWEEDVEIAVEEGIQDFFLDEVPVAAVITIDPEETEAWFEEDE